MAKSNGPWPTLSALAIGALAGALALYFSGFSEFKFEQGFRAGVKEQRSKYDALPAGEQKGVWLYSNLEPSSYFLSKSPKTEKFRGPVLFNTYLAYSPYFAKQYGYPETYVAKGLPDFVDYIAFDMKYAGDFDSCNIKMLIDKDAPVQLYDKDVYQPFSGSSLNMMRAAQPPHVPGFHEQEYQQKYRLQESEYDGSRELQHAIHGSFALIGLKDVDKPTGVGASVTLTPEVIKHHLFKEWNYVELSAGCNSFVKHIVEQKHVFVSMRRTGIKGFAWVYRGSMPEMVNVELPDLLLKPVQADFAKIDFNQ